MITSLYKLELQSGLSGFIVGNLFHISNVKPASLFTSLKDLCIAHLFLAITLQAIFIAGTIFPPFHGGCGV